MAFTKTYKPEDLNALSLILQFNPRTTLSYKREGFFEGFVIRGEGIWFTLPEGYKKVLFNSDDPLYFYLENADGETLCLCFLS